MFNLKCVVHRLNHTNQCTRHYTLLYSTTACHTYADVIEQVQRPGSELHKGWAHLPAPEIAIAYWRLPKDAMFVDTLKCMVSNDTSSPLCHLVTPIARLSISNQLFLLCLFHTCLGLSSTFCIVIFYPSVSSALLSCVAAADMLQFADETHHRDVNHTFAEMDSQAPSPFAMQSKRDALRAFELDATGQTAWPSAAETEAAAASRAAAKMTAAVAAADLVSSKKK
jgi:hypothetical protein